MQKAVTSLPSVDEAFQELLRRIELNPTRVDLASQRYNAIKQVVESALPGKVVRQIGSFQRHTKIRPADLGDQLDIDVLVSFGRFTHYAVPASDGITPLKALEIVRAALNSTQIYKVMPQQRDQPVIRLHYSDGITIELAPAFEDFTGQKPRAAGMPACYIVGTASGNWQAADYDYDAQVITSLNAQSKGALVPSIKMLKAYFRSVSVPLKSFHIEVLAANIIPQTIAGWQTRALRFGYQHILASFLTQSSKVMTNPAVLPGSYSPPINSGLSQSTLAMIGTFLGARAEIAWSLAGEQMLSKALVGWREFFGDIFPAF